MASTASRYIEEQQATQQVCVGGWGALGRKSLETAQNPLLIAILIPSDLQLILDQQDQQLEMVSGSIRVLKHMSGRVGEELDEQGM